MTIDEINEEIRAARMERRQRKQNGWPTLGMRVAKAWYSGYQAVVSGLPRCGNRTTKKWYWDYQNSVIPPCNQNGVKKTFFEKLGYTL